MAESTPPNHFFKFISPGSQFNLSIPRSFWTKLSGEGRDKPILRRGCREWPVDISDTGLFGDGWRTFVEDNGVEELDFVVFKHQGNLVFDLIVFDQSLCERQYPLVLSDEIMDVKDHVTKSDSIYPCESSKKHKKRKRNTYSSESKDKFQLDDDCSFVSIMRTDHIKSSRVHVPMKFARSNGLKRTHTEVVVMDEAQRSWPATLKITKNQSWLMGWSELRMQNHIQVGDSCMFRLVKHGEAAVFHIYNLGKKPVENHLQVKNGSSTNSTLKNHPYFTSTPLTPKHDHPEDIGQVKSCNNGKYGSIHINRESFEEMDVKQPLTDSGSIQKDVTRHKARAVQPFPPQIKENFQRDDDTCFVTTMTPYSIGRARLTVPLKFSRSNGLIIERKHKRIVYTKVVVMDEEHRTWPATLEVKRTQTRLIAWRKLIKKNHIQSGDSCMIEFVKHRQTPTFKIYNLRKKPIQVKETSSTHAATDLGKKPIQVKETSLTHNNHPYFVSTLKPCTFSGSYLYIPVDFSIPNGLKTGKIILTDDKRRSWDVQLKKKGGKYFYLQGCGLKAWCDANGLKKGDAYKFELVENEMDKPPVVNISCPTTPPGNDDCHTSSAM